MKPGRFLGVRPCSACGAVVAHAGRYPTRDHLEACPKSCTISPLLPCSRCGQLVVHDHGEPHVFHRRACLRAVRELGDAKREERRGKRAAGA